MLEVITKYVLGNEAVATQAADVENETQQVGENIKQIKQAEQETINIATANTQQKESFDSRMARIDIVYMLADKLIEDFSNIAESLIKSGDFGLKIAEQIIAEGNLRLNSKRKQTDAMQAKIDEFQKLIDAAKNNIAAEQADL